MSGRKVYHVTQNQNGKWQGKLENGQKASVTGDTKKNVLAQTKEYAKNADLGQVIVHGQNGRIQTEYTYGKDPRDIKG